MRLADLKTFIRNNAFEMGFSAVGIAPAIPIKEYDHLKKWLSLNYHGRMDWLKRDPRKRCDPRSLLPSANCVICLALAYGENGINNNPSKKKDGHVARFARGEEYHTYVRRKLEELWDIIKKHYPSARSKFCVDTSPILEKALAVMAGLGWPGKNSLVVNPNKGSYFVLGEIITDLSIEADDPLNHSCGDCTKCLTACPTGAIIKPHIIDSRRCLSYLTIEHKGILPKEYNNCIKPDQYGCDICQEVCPYNQSPS